MKNLCEYELLKTYCGEIPEFIAEFASTSAMLRLKKVGMNCGCEYTALHSLDMHGKYTRYEHSIGVALIVWNFTHDIRQSLAGLFHDISTPAFAHVVDYMNGDHMTQESTEELTAQFIENSDEIQTLLKKYGIETNEVSDYHIYPIADNDSPRLSADRLEYTFGNFLVYGVAELSDIEKFYCDISVGINESGEQELVFSDKKIAEEFAICTMTCSHIYVSSGDRFTMQYLADLLKSAAEKGVVNINDLYIGEEYVIEKLLSDETTAAGWREYCGISRVDITNERCVDKYSVKIDAKRRYIDPFVKNVGRVSAYSENYSVAVDEFLSISFDNWLSIGEKINKQ